MRIADHCKPDGWRGRSEPYTPTCEWPEDCYVQWGSGGIVFSETGSYRTAFFESFPSDPATFIRGEGETVAIAEAKAFLQFQRFRACAGHEFERRKYTNGAGFCKHCGLFKGKAFEPLPTDPDAPKSRLQTLLEGKSPEDEALIIEKFFDDLEAPQAAV